MSVISKFVSKTSPKYLLNLIKLQSKYLNFLNRNYSSSKLSQILAEAEKVIRVPLSHFNVKHLLKDEFDITIFTMNKVNTRYISESNHPIVEIARNIFGTDESETNQSWNQLNSITGNTGSLLLLLIAKVSESLPSFKCDESIIKNQYDFAEIYQMINKALFIHHEAVVNLPINSDAIRSEILRLNDANKISILGGDYLLSYAIVRLTHLIPNIDTLKLLLCAIDDYCIYHFNGLPDSDGNLMPSNHMSILDWEEMAGYSLTKLLAYCCQIMLLLAKHSDRHQKAAFDFGYNLQLIWNLKDELESFTNPNTNTNFKLISAPVIFHMEYDHNFSTYIKSHFSTKTVDFSKIRQMIIDGPAIEKCHKHLELYTLKAIKSLDVFPNSISKEILKNAIIA